MSVGALGGWSGPVRLVLLAAVAVGLVQMHVFGHAAGRHGQGVGDDSMAVHVAMAPSPVPGQAVSVQEPDPGWPSPSLDVLAVCLAVLTSIVLAGLVALFTRGSRGLAALGCGSPRRECSVRGPPVFAVSVGRRLAAQSVLRI